MMQGRSREGAWIEMVTASTKVFVFRCRSREGAWIEIAPLYLPGLSQASLP